MELDINFADVPDKVLPIDPGIYLALVESVELKEASGKLKDRYELSLKITGGIEGPTPMEGRKIFDSFGVEYLRDTKSPAAVKFVHMLRSAGINPAAKVNTDDIKGKSVRINVTHRNYTDDSGVAQTATNLKDYVYSA